MMELLISWCVTSSILLAVFLLLRGTLFRKLSPRVRYALWGVVLLRLLVPFQIPSLSLPASAADLAPEVPVLSNRPLSPDTAMGHAVIPSDLLEENGLTITDGGTVQASPSGQDAALWELQENGEVYLYFGGPTLNDVFRALSPISPPRRATRKRRFRPSSSTPITTPTAGLSSTYGLKRVSSKKATASG